MLLLSCPAPFIWEILHNAVQEQGHVAGNGQEKGTCHFWDGWIQHVPLCMVWVLLLVFTRAAGPVLGPTRRATSCRWDLWFPQEDSLGINTEFPTCAHSCTMLGTTHPQFPQFSIDNLHFGGEQKRNSYVLAGCGQSEEPENHLRKSGRKPGVGRRENWNQETRSLSPLVWWTLDQVMFTHQRGFSFTQHPVQIQWYLPTCTDDAAPGEAAQTSCLRKAACSIRNILSLPVRFPGKEHSSVHLPMVQMSVWNRNDIYQRGLEIVTGGLQIMKPMPFIDTRGSCLIWDVGCQKTELFCGGFPSEAILCLISRFVLTFKSELFSAFRFGVSS